MDKLITFALGVVIGHKLHSVGGYCTTCFGRFDPKAYCKNVFRRFSVKS